MSLIPTHAGISMITVLPEQLQSPLMTAEWEHRLKEIERGEESPETFMQGIRGMVCELVKTYKTVLGADVLFPSGRAVVGKCPRCGSDVTESKRAISVSGMTAILAFGAITVFLPRRKSI